MAKKGKKYLESLKKIEADKLHDPSEALALVKQLASAKFDETVDIAVKLGVDPRHADQQLRGAVSLPAGTGRTVKVAVFAKGDKEKEAEAAGADVVGSDDLIAKVQGGWMDFDVAVATPDMMGSVGKLGRILGPRGLMPNPKTGTVTFDIEKAVKEIKAGKIEYRTEKNGIVHAPIGKVSFTEEQLMQNFTTLLDTLIKAKPAAAKGQYLRSVTLSTTMGPAVPVNPQKIVASK